MRATKCARWSLRLFEVAVFYKHAAPLAPLSINHFGTRIRMMSDSRAFCEKPVWRLEQRAQPSIMLADLMLQPTVTLVGNLLLLIVLKAPAQSVIKTVVTLEIGKRFPSDARELAGSLEGLGRSRKLAGLFRYLLAVDLPRGPQVRTHRNGGAGRSTRDGSGGGQKHQGFQIGSESLFV